jgi:hypothetical protein
MAAAYSDRRGTVLNDTHVLRAGRFYGAGEPLGARLGASPGRYRRALAS